MKTDELGRLRVFVEGVNLVIGSSQIVVSNNYTLISTSSNWLDFSNSFELNTDDGTVVSISASFGNPVDIGLANFSGSSQLIARADHVHNHGNLTGSFLHNTASSIANGFMSSGSYNLLVSLPTSITQSLLLYQLRSEKNQPNGYVGLDSASKISASFIPYIPNYITVSNSGSILTTDVYSFNFVGFQTSVSGNNVTVVSTTSGSIGNIFECYQTASQVVANAPSTTNVKFDFTRTTSSLYSVNVARDTITFLQAGTYHVEYRVTIANAVNKESSAMTALFHNGTAVSGSFAYSFHRSSTSGTTTAVGFATLTVAANDTLQVRTQRNSGAGSLVTVTNGTNLIITRWI